MNTMLKRIVSMFLCLVLVAGYLPAGALAAETEETVVTAAAEATNAPSVVELSDEATGVVEEEAAEAEENEEESLTADTGDPEEAVSEEEITSEEVPAEEETSEEVTSEEETSEEEITEEETSEEAAEEAAAFELEAAPVDVSLLDASGSVVVIAGSDYQASTAGDTMKNIMEKQIQKDYASVYGILMGGDYSAGSTKASDIVAVNGVISGVYPDIAAENRIFVQGNHDGKTMGRLTPSNSMLSTTGAHDTDHYGVYSINDDDFTSAVTGLQTYLNVKSGYTKPIFVVSHRPLHDTNRGGDPDATAIFGALQDAGEAGLNIIYMFGHNHSGQHDDYLGGGAIYLKKGDTMKARGGSSAETLNFTYMNCGYVGYSRSGADNGLTMTAFEITDSQVTVKRYDANGLHNLKSAGTGTNANTTVYTSPQTITLTTSTDDNTGSTGGNEGSGSTGGNSGSTGGSQISETVSITSAKESTGGASADATIAVGQELVINLTNGSANNPKNYTVTVDNGTVAEVTSEASFNLEKGATTQVKVVGKASGTTKVVMNGAATSSYAQESNYVATINLTVTEGSEGGSQGGGSTVTPEGGDWVTVTEPNGGTVTYTYELATSITAGGSYVIVGNDHDVALTASMGGETVNVSGTKITSNTALTEWTFSGTSSGTIMNGANYLRYSKSSGNFQVATTNSSNEFNYTYNTSESNFALQVNRDSGTDYYFYYNGSSWGRDNDTQRVRLYKPAGTTPGDDATPGLFAKITGNLEYNVERGLTDEQVIALVRAEIKGYKYSGTSAPGDDVTGTEITSELEFVLDESFNGMIGGQYAVDIMYNDVVLGTATVTVPDATITGITVDPASGVVTVGASEAAQVGATVIVHYNDNTSSQVPATVSMLSGNGLTTENVGTYEGLTVTYKGFTFTGFTLTVKEKVVNNYPSYPNEGAVKVDKKAHGVDFQKTGVAQVELTTSGVPMNQGVDVVIMLDTSSSMTRDITVDGKKVKRIDLLRPAVNELIEQLQTKRPDGSNPDIDIVIASFNGNTINTDSNYISDGSSKPQISGTGTDDCGVLTGQKTVKSGWVDIMSLSTEWGSSSSNLPTGSGTNYDYGLELVYELLEQKQKDNGESTRKQFVLFMSDGAPSQYNGVWANDGVAEFAEWLLGNYDETDNSTSNNIPNTVSDTHKTFYTGYRAGKGQLHRAAEAIKGAPSDTFAYVTYDANGNGSLKTVKGLGATVYSIGLLLQDVSSNSGSSSPRTAEDQQTVLNTIASSEDLAISITTVDGLGETFTRFGNDVLYAAENAVFEDQMGSKFNIQLASTTKRKVDGEVFTLNPAPTIEVREYTIWTRSELENANGTLSEENAKKVGTRKTDASGNYIYNTLEVVRFNADGTKAYSNKINIDNDNIVGWSTGTDDKITLDEEDNILNAGIISAKTFWYNNGTTTVKVDVDGNGTAETDLAPETFIWKVGTIKTTELALSYYVYLDDSLEGDASAGSYETNKYAILTYDNYLGNPCQKETISPQLAWLSANVSYAYYLVNRNGVPVNANGEEVTFANREVIVHPTKYGEIKLNSIEDVENLKVASTGVLDEGNYALFDYDAEYLLSVNSDATGGWTIKVGNGKPATTYVTGFSSTQPFTNATTSNSETDNYDYTHTTVWFAVVWEPDALDDTVVVDYGLPVDVHVLTNDFFGDFGELIGVAKGAVTDSDGNIRTNEILASTDPVAGNYGSALVRKPETGANESNSVIRYELNSMEMKEPEVFTYSVEYTNTKLQTNNGFYYGTLTVIPATTIYYEDTFLDLASYTKNPDDGSWPKDENAELYGNDGKWEPVGIAVDANQDEDRPGDINFAFDTIIDANNVYGNDSAYETMSTYSLGSAAKVHVDSDSYATANFSFYGTGFDVISMTSNMTGTIVVKVTEVGDLNENGKENDVVKNTVVDTYYGMNADGTTEDATNNPEALYQVPVIKIFDLPYGQYNVTITASYGTYFDHTEEDGYDLYLDAIRIYDPTGNENEIANDAYIADGEGWPSYFEVRDQILSKATFDSLTTDTVAGAVFIDCKDSGASVEEYKSFGPNNETYLAAGQAITFDLEATAEKGEVAKVQLAVKSVGGTASVKVYAPNGTGEIIALDADITTATDMYYDITALNGKNVVIMNDGEDGILSITNVKVTYTEDQTGIENKGGLFMLRRSSVEEVLESLNMEDEVPETTVPGESEPVVPETTEPEDTKPTEPVKPDNSELKAAVNAAKKLKAKDYTQASFKKLETAIKAAEKVLKDKKATQAQIDKALADLNAALDALEAKPDNSELKAAVNAAKKLKEKDYTQASFKKLETAIKAAEKVLKDKNATQTRIDQALENLNAALDALEAKPDNSELKAAVNAAKKLKEKDYTRESFKAVETARKAAEKVLKNKNATQDQIDEALAELNEAVEALEAAAPKSKPGKKR